MVVGNGMIAKRFQPFADHKEFIIFAAGVSNSRANDAAAYERETTLLKETVRAYPAAALVYFSTCCLYDPAEVNSPYTQHKQQIENYIRSECNRYHVFRISHLAGISDNNHTILNFLVRNIFNERKFSLWTNATRNIIDVDDAYQIIDYILNENMFVNQITNIASPINYSVKEIVEIVERYSGKKANYICVEKGCPFDVDISGISPIIEKLELRFHEDYLEKILRKYFPIS